MSSKGWKLIVFKNPRAFFIKNLASKPLTPLLVSQLASMSDRFRCKATAMSSNLRNFSEPVKGIRSRMGIPCNITFFHFRYQLIVWESKAVMFRVKELEYDTHHI